MRVVALRADRDLHVLHVRALQLAEPEQEDAGTRRGRVRQACGTEGRDEWEEARGGKREGMSGRRHAEGRGKG